MADLQRSKERACEVVDGLAAELVDLSHRIHARPELGYEERYAAAELAGLLAGAGLDVERGAYGVETAFAARAGANGGPHVVVCCEYDALPGIGHGCGHNVIAAAGAGAGIALAALAAEAGGRVTVLGTPAEEQGGGGKVRLLDAGAFSGADAAMMVHPAVGDVAWAPHLANVQLHVAFHGRPAHASASPWEGVNALDALVLAYTGVAALRQHIRAGERIHGIITDGGEADNIVPAHTAGRFRVRAPDRRALAALRERVLACFTGAATQTGARLEHEWVGGYAELRRNRALAAAYQANGEALGRRFHDPDRIPLSAAGSTDMGNVSQAVPALHPMIAIAPPGTPGHSPAFADAAASPAADRAVLDGAKALAMTALDVWARPELRAAAHDEWTASAPPA